MTGRLEYYSPNRDHSDLLLASNQELQRLSEQYDVPQEDAFLIALNCSGIRYRDIINDRGRFVATFPGGRSYLLTLTLTNRPFSPFSYKEGCVQFDDQTIAQASPIEKDACTSSYWRGNKKHLTLNSNSRSKCRGCSFCGTYSLEGDDKSLTQPDDLRRKAESLCVELGSDFSQLESVGLVTGCFPGEKRLLDHLLMIRNIFSEFGFTGEIRYIGSQLRSVEALKAITDSGPFAVYFTVETFSRREQLMKRIKASLNLVQGREVLREAKKMGAETCFLYIAGLDTHQKMWEEFPLYLPVVTRLPQIQIFQAYTPNQISIRLPEAAKLEYFLQTRKIVETIFPHLLPIASLNYRSLWYTKYGSYDLPNQKYEYKSP